MLKITNKKLGIFLLCIFFILLVPVVWGVIRSGSTTQNPDRNAPQKKIIPFPTYIPKPEIISDSTPTDSEVNVVWEVDEKNLPTESNFYSIPEVGVDAPGANLIAQKFGFTGTSKTLSSQNPILTWTNGGKAIQIHLDSGFVIYTSSEIRGKSDTDGQVRKEISTDEEAIAIADAFIQPLGLSSENLSLVQNNIKYITTEGEIDPSLNEDAEYSYQITYSYQLEGNPIYLQRGNNEVVRIVVDRLGTVSQLQYWNFVPFLADRKVGLIPFSDIKSGIINGSYQYSFLGVEDVITPPEISLLRISGISFGYLYDFSSPYFFPVYILTGTGTSSEKTSPLTITVPAIKSD